MFIRNDICVIQSSTIDDVCSVSCKWFSYILTPWFNKVVHDNDYDKHSDINDNVVSTRVNDLLNKCIIDNVLMRIVDFVEHDGQTYYCIAPFDRRDQKWLHTMWINGKCLVDRTDNVPIINIDQNSWHYKLVRKYHGRPSIATSLCPYVWQVVRAIIAIICSTITMITLGVLGIACALFLVGAPFAYVFQMDWFSDQAYQLASAGDILILLVCWHMVRSKRINKQVKIANHRPSSLFGQYVRARKRKVCPGLNFND